MLLVSEFLGLLPSLVFEHNTITAHLVPRTDQVVQVCPPKQSNLLICRGGKHQCDQNNKVNVPERK